ncbi:MAG: hypothetical protein EGR77_00580 [Pseudobutyrivibrio sp.]|nr:hypothetical protein [Pseudobutyrivibrio sp.]
MINLFIDTNIWLAMFHLSKDDLEALNQLKELIGKEIKIYIPRQVKYEYLRNRDSKIKDALDKFKIIDVQFPNLVKCYDEYDDLKRKFDELKKEHCKLTEKVTRDVMEQNTPADIAISELFDKTEIIECSNDTVNKAKLRYDLGNPPGKKNSYGDAVNWECLLENIPDGEDLYFISDDKDYCSELCKNQFNIYLMTEWNSIKNSNIYFYRSLHDFLLNKYKDYNIILEKNKERWIGELYESSSFLETHSIISKLMDYSDLSQKNISDICTAAVENNQINWIIQDDDISTFYKNIIRDFKGEDESVMNVKKMLDT